MRISVFVLVWARYVPVGCRKINCIESVNKKNNQSNETHCTFLLKLRHVAHIVMYNLKASLYVTVCLPGFLTEIYGELKSWADFVFRSSVNRKIHQANKSVFEEIVGYDASVSVSVQLCKHAWSKPS